MNAVTALLRLLRIKPDGGLVLGASRYDRYDAQQPAKPALHAGQAGHAINSALEGVPPVWHAVPGARIELGDTGFAIALVTGNDCYFYELHSPDGHILSRAIDLPALKQVAEKLASERREFLYRAREVR